MPFSVPDTMRPASLEVYLQYLLTLQKVKAKRKVKEDPLYSIIFEKDALIARSNYTNIFTKLESFL